MFVDYLSTRGRETREANQKNNFVLNCFKPMNLSDINQDTIFALTTPFSRSLPMPEIEFNDSVLLPEVNGTQLLTHGFPLQVSETIDGISLVVRKTIGNSVNGRQTDARLE